MTLKWVHHQLARMPTRVVPLILTDANARLGITHVDGAPVVNPSPAVGECQPDGLLEYLRMV